MLDTVLLWVVHQKVPSFRTGYNATLRVASVKARAALSFSQRNLHVRHVTGRERRLVLTSVERGLAGDDALRSREPLCEFGMAAVSRPARRGPLVEGVPDRRVGAELEERLDRLDLT